jgi:hypothetical protein
MPVVKLPFTNGFYISESLPVSAQNAINCYPVVNQAPGLSEEFMVSIPGISQLCTTGTINQQNRGGWTLNEVPYFVNGSSLYRINSDFTVTTIGTVEGIGRVSMADNGKQLVVLVPGGKGYVYNQPTNTFAEITDVDFRANGEPQYVAFVDGYFVFTTDEKKFIVSALNDGMSYNALDFGTAESDPDRVVAPIVYKNQLFITGLTTSDGFQNAGGGDFPFVRSGMFLDKGVNAPFSLIKTQDSFMFVGGGLNESPAIWMMAGGGVQKVSTTAVDNLLQTLTSEQVSAIYAWTYAQNGAYFAGFALPNVTLVYDFASKRWHQRQSYAEANVIAYRVSSIITAYGRIMCSDIYSGRIGEMSPNTYDEYGNNIIREITTQPFQNNMQSLFVPSIELTMESGVGNSACPDPQIVMNRSIDAKNWDAPRMRAVGKVGAYNQRAIWRRNGRAARFEVFRFTYSEKTKFVAIQLTANIIGGDK